MNVDIMIEKMLETLSKMAALEGTITTEDIKILLTENHTIAKDDIEKIIVKIVTSLDDLGIEVIDKESFSDAISSNKEDDVSFLGDEEPIDKASSSIKEKDILPEVQSVNNFDDDPVHRYLKLMGNVELLTKEGEKALAIEIEEGRERMVSVMCFAPIVIEEFFDMYDKLINEEILLRDVIDLDATYPKHFDCSSKDHVVDNIDFDKDGDSEFRSNAENIDADTLEDEDSFNDGLDDKGDDYSETLDFDDDSAEHIDFIDPENSISIVSMERSLKLIIIGLFEELIEYFTEFLKLKNDLLFAGFEDIKLENHDEIIAKLEEISNKILDITSKFVYNSLYIDKWIEILYKYFDDLMTFENKLIRLVTARKIKSTEFIKIYQKNEISGQWIEYIKNSSKPKWKRFWESNKEEVEIIAAEIVNIAKKKSITDKRF